MIEVTFHCFKSIPGGIRWHYYLNLRLCRFLCLESLTTRQLAFLMLARSVVSHVLARHNFSFKQISLEYLEAFMGITPATIG